MRPAGSPSASTPSVHTIRGPAPASPPPWGSREPLDVTLVVPELAAEVDADTAIDHGTRRHPMRYVRLRLDITAAEVPPFGAGVTPAADDAPVQHRVQQAMQHTACCTPCCGARGPAVPG